MKILPRIPDRKSRLPVLAAAAMLVNVLAGCTDETGDAPEGHLLEDQQRAMERARAVEEDLQEAARRKAEEIEESEGGR